MARTYQNGRPTTGWHKGERITSPQQVSPGDVLIGVNHQFMAENLYLVIPSPHPKSPHQDQGFYIRYIKPDLSQTHTDFEPQWVWEFDLSGEREFYRQACVLMKHPVIWKATHQTEKPK